MKKIRLWTVLTAIAFLVVLAGCGNKGDLVRPSDAPEKPAST